MKKRVKLQCGKTVTLKDNQRIVYKIVRPIGLQFRSQYAEKKYGLTYELGVELVPKIGKIFTYNKKNVMKEAAYYDTILECIGTNCVGKRVCPTHFSSTTIERFWKAINTNGKLKQMNRDSNIGAGFSLYDRNVVFCDSIKPIGIFKLPEEL